jgi:hypothetical protein
MKIYKKFIEKIFPNPRDLVEVFFEEISRGNNEKGYKVLNYIFKKIFSNLPKEYIKCLEETIYKVCFLNIGCHFFDEKQINLIKKTYDLNFYKLSKEKWLDLEYLSIRIGLFKLSFVFREKAIKRSYKDIKEKRNRQNIFSLFSAMIDGSDFDHAFTLLEESKNILNKKDYNKMLFYFLLCSKENLLKFNLEDYHFTRIERDYFNYISGKRIAIVGPAPTNIKNGKEIDSFDIIIRLGYKGSNYLPDKSIFGSKINVSYYGDGNTEYYIVNYLGRFLEDLDWIIFKSNKYEKDISKIKLNNYRYFKINNFYFSGSPTMIQNTVFDIMHFNPSKVKIFNTNFNLSKNTHYKEYHPNMEQRAIYLKGIKASYYNIWPDQKKNTGGFAHHNMLSQLNFIRNLWINGKIEVDEDCAKVINMSNDEYLEKMENIYIKSFLEK